MRKLLRLAVRLLIILTLFVAVILLFLQLPPAARWVAQTAVDAVNPWPGTTASIGDVRGSWICSLDLYQVSISNPDQTLLISFDTLSVSYSLPALLRGEIRVNELILRKPVIRTGVDSNGFLSFLAPFKSEDATPDSSAPPLIAGERVTVSDGEFALHSGGGDSAVFLRVTGFSLSAHSIRIKGNISASIDTLDVGYSYNRGGRPGQVEKAVSPDNYVRVRAAGSISDSLLNVRSLAAVSTRSSVAIEGWISLPISLPETVPEANFEITASPIAYGDLTPFVPGIGPEGQAKISLQVRGSGQKLEASGHLEPRGGGVGDIECVAWNPRAGILAVDLQLSTKSLSIAGLTGGVDSSEKISSKISIHGEGTGLADLTGTSVVTIQKSSFHTLTPLEINSRHDIRQGVISSDITGTGGPLQIALKSRISPFAFPPGFELDGSFVLPHRASPSPENLATRLAGLRGIVHASGKGFDPESTDASVDLQGKWERNTHVKSFTLHSSLAGGRIRATADLKTRSGEAGLTAEAVLGDQISYSVDPLYFHNLDLAFLLGYVSRSSLSGSLAVKGRGTDPAAMTGEARLYMKSSTLFGIDIDTLTARVDLINGAIGIAASALTGAGSFGLKANADIEVDRPFAEITDFTFHNLDLSKLGGDSTFQTDLNGTLSAHASGSAADGLQRPADGLSPRQSDAIIAKANLVFQESRINRQRLNGGALEAALRGREVLLSVDVRTPEGGFSSEAVARPFEESPELTVPLATFEHINLGSWISVAGFTTDLTGSCSIHHLGNSLETANSSVRLRFLRSSINKEFLADAYIEGDLDSGKIGVTTTWTFGHGRVDGNVRGVLADGGFSGAGGATVRMEDLGLLLNDDRFSPSRVAVDVAADGTWGSPGRTRMKATLGGRGRVDSLEADSVVCRLSVLGRTVEVDTLLIRLNVGSIAGSGSLAILDTTREAVSGFSAAAVLHSLKPLEHLLDLPPTELDSARLSFTVTGPAQSAQLIADATISSFIIGDNSVGLLEASATGSFRDIAAVLASQPADQVTAAPARHAESQGGSLEILHPVAREAAHTESQAAPDGELPVSARVTARDARIENLQITHADVTLTSDGKRHEIHMSAIIADSLDVRAAGAFVADTPNSTIIIDSLQLIGPKYTWNLQRPASILFGEKLRVNDFDLRTRTQSIRADGVLDPKGEQDFMLRADSLGFSTLGLILHRPELDGTCSVELRITGPAAAARATASMNADIHTKDQPIGQFRASLDWHDSLLSINAEATQPGGGLFTVVAGIPRVFSLAPQERAAPQPAVPVHQRPMDLQLRADRFSLEMIHPFLDPQTFEDLAGILTADISGRGRPDSLSFSGRLAIDSGLVRLPSLGVTYDRITLRSSLEGGDLQLDSVYIHSGPGGLVGRGAISFRDLEKIAPRLRLSASDFLAIQTPQMEATVSGDLEVTGTAVAPEIAGKIVLGETEIQLPDLGGAASVEDVELTQEDYRMLLERFGVRKKPVELKKEKSSFEGLTLGIDIEMHRNTWIRKKTNPNLAIELEGNLHLTSRPGKPFTLSGELRPVPGRSFVGQFGRQFEIIGGEIYFGGRPEDLELRIESEYKVPSKGSSGLSEVLIHMRVASKQGRFTFELTSDPAMAESDILTYLATGKSSTGALAGTVDQGNLGSAMALEQLVGAAQGLAEGKVPLDVFQIRQDGARGITIVAGNYVSSRLYVGVRQPLLFEQGTQDTRYDTGTQGEFEYEATPWLFLNFQGGANRIMLFCKSRYVY